MQIYELKQKKYTYYKRGELTLKQGSSYMKIDKETEIKLTNSKSETKIKLIINISGLCDKGKVSFELDDDKNHIIKKMFKYCTWHSDIPLFTKPTMLNIDRINKN